MSTFSAKRRPVQLNSKHFMYKSSYSIRFQSTIYEIQRDGLLFDDFNGLSTATFYRLIYILQFLDNRHASVAGLSAPHTGSLYPLGDIPGTHFC